MPALIKLWPGIEVISGILISTLSAPQDLKPYIPKAVRLVIFRGLKDFKFEHPLKLDLPIVCKAEDSVMFVTDLQFKNEEKPVVTTSGAISCVSDAFPLKVESPTPVTLYPVSFSTFDKSRVPAPSKYFKRDKFRSFDETVMPHPVVLFVKTEGDDSGIASHSANKEVAENKNEKQISAMSVLIMVLFYISRLQKSNYEKSF